MTEGPTHRRGRETTSRAGPRRGPRPRPRPPAPTVGPPGHRLPSARARTARRRPCAPHGPGRGPRPRSRCGRPAGPFRPSRQRPRPTRPPRRRTAPVREPERRGPGRRRYSHRATLLTSPGSDRVDSSVKLRQPDHHWYTLGERRPPTRDGGARSGVGRTTVSRHAAGGDEDRWQSSQTRTPAGRLRAGPLPGPGRARPPLPPWPGRPGPAVAPETRPAPFDPSECGRVDESGTVYVRTADGERRVGAWQAGSPEDGLAHFGLRFDDLAAEVGLLEARLTSHPRDARKTRASAETLAGQIPEAAAVGDLDSLSRRLATVIERSGEVEEDSRRRRERDRAAAIARKEELAAEAEEIGASSTQWKAAGNRLRAILDEWKTIRGIDRKTDDALWKRFSKAREAFNRRRGSHFAELDRTRAAVKRVKEELVVRAEAMSDSTDWNETATAYRRLMDEWKAAGRAPREADDALWQRFKAAQDTFFDARHAAAAERDAEFEANATAKEALLAEYEGRIDPAADL